MKLKCKESDEDTTRGRIYENVVIATTGDKIKVVYHGDKGGLITEYFDSVSELCDRWEVYQEPRIRRNDRDIVIRSRSEKRAKHTVKMLEAWNRLADNGMRVECSLDYQGDHNESVYGSIDFEVPNYDGVVEDVNLLFGGGK